MTNERRLLVSVDEIKALVFECKVNDCGARISIRPEKIEGVPVACPRGHAWKWDTLAEKRLQGSLLHLLVINLKHMQVSAEHCGFRIFLEFEEPKS